MSGTARAPRDSSVSQTSDRALSDRLSDGRLTEHRAASEPSSRDDGALVRSRVARLVRIADHGSRLERQEVRRPRASGHNQQVRRRRPEGLFTRRLLPRDVFRYLTDTSAALRITFSELPRQAVAACVPIARRRPFGDSDGLISTQAAGGSNTASRTTPGPATRTGWRTPANPTRRTVSPLLVGAGEKLTLLRRLRFEPLDGGGGVRGDRDPGSVVSIDARDVERWAELRQ